MKKDLSTKLIALLFAIFLWFYIIQVQSPEVDRTIKSVPVQFTKAELERKNLMLLNDREVTVDIKVKGQRRYIMGINKSDITVMADVSSIETVGTHRVFPVAVMPYGNIEIVEQNPPAITVTADQIVKERKEVKIITSGNPRNGYVVGDIKGTPETVTLRGAKSIISSIAYVAAEVNVSGKDEDISSIEPLYFVGTSDTEINTPYVTMEEDTVDVHCAILKKKKLDIDVKFASGINTEKEWYAFDLNSVKSIEVAGTAAAIDELEKIETKTVYRSMISETGEVEVELALPEGVRSLDGNTVTLKLKKESKKE